jgi:hypothetical protein
MKYKSLIILLYFWLLVENQICNCKQFVFPTSGNLKTYKITSFSKKLFLISRITNQKKAAFNCCTIRLPLLMLVQGDRLYQQNLPVTQSHTLNSDQNPCCKISFVIFMFIESPTPDLIVMEWPCPWPLYC